MWPRLIAALIAVTEVAPILVCSWVLRDSISWWLCICWFIVCVIYGMGLPEMERWAWGIYFKVRAYIRLRGLS